MVARINTLAPAGCLLASLSLLSPAGLALNDQEVREMERVCEERRAEELAPIRERRTQTCIEQRLRRPESCETYYSTYGNVSRLPTGAMQAGFYYDLPECQEWLQAREALRASRSRN